MWGEPSCEPYLHCEDHLETRRRCKLFEDEQQSSSLKKDQIMITNTKKYERMKFIYEKEMPTEEWVSKEKDEIAGTESKKEGMSNGSKTKGKNEQEKREVNE